MEKRIISVDRKNSWNFNCAEYKMLMYPDLEKSGPDQIDLSLAFLWLHSEQMHCGSVAGDKIFTTLRWMDAINMCLGLHDGLAIQKLGVEVFRKYFQGNNVVLWKSVAEGKFGLLYVPYLHEIDNELKIGWHCLDEEFNAFEPALIYLN